MPGRLPKDLSVRQRTNRTSTRAVLHPLAEDEIEVPPLPTRLDDDGNEILWSSHLLRYWLRIWSSPMASEFHAQSDIEGLYRLAVLVEQFWRKPSATLNAEIRLYEQQFGLNPLARRRLEWTIAGAERATDEQAARAERKASKAPKPQAVPDASDEDPLSA
jgi:hypothetical protein